MFTHLIASRPARTELSQGTTVSLLFHGALLTLAILASAHAESELFTARPQRTVPITFAPPTPPVERRAPEPPPQPAPVVRAPQSTPLPAPPVVVPSSIPEPSSTPWTPTVPATPSTGVGDPNAPVGAPSTPTGSGSGDPLGAAEVDVPAALLPRSPLPRYPFSLQSARLAGSVRARFVVGTDGRVEMSSVQILESTHPAFAEAVRAVLPRMRFRPARVGHRAVRQLVEFPVGFRAEP